MPAADKKQDLDEEMNFTWLMNINLIIGDSSTGPCVSPIQSLGFWLFLPPGTFASASKNCRYLEITTKKYLLTAARGFVRTYFWLTAS